MKLVSVNIEFSRHLDLVRAFVEAQRPDVLCLQELCARDIPLFEDMMGQKLLFAPMLRHPFDEGAEVVGVGMVARSPLQDATVTYYVGGPDQIKDLETFRDADGALHARPHTICNALVMGTVDGVRLSTTHFTWSFDGRTTPEHLRAAATLLEILEPLKQDGVILCGDMNAPRGRGTFGVFAEHFADHIPPHYKTSLDPTVHRSGNRLPAYMVDALFATPHYTVANVCLHAGVSDHLALTADIAPV